MVVLFINDSCGLCWLFYWLNSRVLSTEASAFIVSSTSRQGQAKLLTNQHQQRANGQLKGTDADTASTDCCRITGQLEFDADTSEMLTYMSIKYRLRFLLLDLVRGRGWVDGVRSW